MKKNNVAIIQARMSSKRLPGKVLMEVDGVPLLEIMLSRVKKSKKVNNIVIATTGSRQDNDIINFCKKYNYNYFIGSENDVLSRYYFCAKEFKADVIIRLTADCPLIDHNIIDDVISLFYTNNVDYASNTVPFESSNFPDGSDVEVFSMEALIRAHNDVNNIIDREHVTFYFWKYGNDFKLAQLSQKNDWSKYRITIDYPEDYEVIKFLIFELKKNDCEGTLNQIIKILIKYPEIFSLNSKYYYGIGWEGNNEVN